MEKRGGEPSWEDLLLLDSVFIITAAVHRGNLAGYIKGSLTAHLYRLTHIDDHAQRHTHALTGGRATLPFNVLKILKEKPYKRLILRLEEAMFQPLLPKLLALGSEVCFYDCSVFFV